MAALGLTLRYAWEKNWPEIHTALTGGLPGFVFGRNPKKLKSGVPVFSYHTIDADEFQTHLNFLNRNGYTTLQADEMLKHLEGGLRAPERAVVLTFDDGARNLYDVVYPVLKAYGMKAVAFIAPGLHIEEDESGPIENDVHERPLSWSQIREMHESGVIDFQSHTNEHRFVPRWPETAPLIGSDHNFVESLRMAPLSIEDDFRISKETLEKKLNKVVRHIAFARYMGSEQAVVTGRALGYESFWWGALPHRPGNVPGQSPCYVPRLERQFLRRLPGESREPIGKILLVRYAGSASRLSRRNKSAA